jgi:hypothetical protein
MPYVRELPEPLRTQMIDGWVATHRFNDQLVMRVKLSREYWALNPYFKFPMFVDELGRVMRLSRGRKPVPLDALPSEEPVEANPEVVEALFRSTDKEPGFTEFSVDHAAMILRAYFASNGHSEAWNVSADRMEDGTVRLALMETGRCETWYVRIPTTIGFYVER